MADNPDQMQLVDLLELLKGGASIKIDRPAQTIAQFDELVATLKKMIDVQESRAQERIVRNQIQLEILATLQSTIKKNAGGVKFSPLDLSPLKTVLDSIAKNSQVRPRTVYEFNIERTDLGFIDKIIAVPKLAA